MGCCGSRVAILAIILVLVLASAAGAQSRYGEARAELTAQWAAVVEAASMAQAATSPGELADARLVLEGAIGVGLDTFAAMEPRRACWAPWLAVVVAGLEHLATAMASERTGEGSSDITPGVAMVQMAMAPIFYGLWCDLAERTA